MEYIRKTYKVPAKVGMEILFRGDKAKIVGASGPYLRIKLNGMIVPIHPTWEVEYPQENLWGIQT